VNIYLAIVLLVLYGDLLKRFLPPNIALLAVYGIAVGLLLFIVATSHGRHRYRSSIYGALVFTAAGFLVLLYLLQLLTSVQAPFIEALTHAFYMVVPLLYVVVVQRFWPDFDLRKFANVFLWLMVPINVVALVQYFVNPTFLVSTSYTGEFGGVVIRNLLDGGAFARFPSIFTSADRYSAMGLMQLYLALALVAISTRIPSRFSVWIAFNVVSGSAALFIAGARSRILLAGAVAALIIITILVNLLKHARRSYWTVCGALVAVLIFTVGMVAISLVGGDLGVEGYEGFPIVAFLMQSFQEGDISARIGQAAEFSLLPDQASLFGAGLGTVGEGGRPGEFGIRSMWIESGLVWGLLMLFPFALLLFVLGRLTFEALVSMRPASVGLFLTPLFIIVLALLTGLTAAFELSTGLVLAVIISAITRDPGEYLSARWLATSVQSSGVKQGT
jgi:hypothetical protein